MRTYTLGFSIVVHLLAVALVVVTPIVATDVMPQPPRAFDFITVSPVEPPRLPQHRGAAIRLRPVPGRDAAPMEAPATIVRDTGIDRFEVEGLSEKHLVTGGEAAGIPGTAPSGDLSAAPAPPPPERPVRVGGSIQPPRKTHHAAPHYPEIARAARVEGVVILEAVIGEDGRVRNLRVLRSIPLLDDAAAEAVRQWQFTPTLLNGEPVPVVMTVTVGFTLR